MDKTPKYIKMCEKAREIQKALKDRFDFRFQGYCTYHKHLLEEIEDGDVACPPFAKKKRITPAANLYGTKEDCYWKEKWIGLPYQDQLQEMICKTKDDCYRIFVNGCYEDNNWNNLDSMEQLWLAFVMREKYNKVWKDEKETWEIAKEE